MHDTQGRQAGNVKEQSRMLPGAGVGSPPVLPPQGGRHYLCGKVWGCSVGCRGLLPRGVDGRSASVPDAWTPVEVPFPPSVNCTPSSLFRPAMTPPYWTP